MLAFKRLFLAVGRARLSEYYSDYGNCPAPKKKIIACSNFRKSFFFHPPIACEPKRIICIYNMLFGPFNERSYRYDRDKKFSRTNVRLYLSLSLSCPGGLFFFRLLFSSGRSGQFPARWTELPEKRFRRNKTEREAAWTVDSSSFVIFPKVVAIENIFSSL